MKIKLLIAFALLLITSCAKNYQAVTEGPKADISFTVNEVRGGLFTKPRVIFFINECSPYQYQGSFVLSASNPTFETTVRAGKPMLLQIQYEQNVGGGKIERGELNLMLEPKVDYKYEVGYVQKGDRFSVVIMEQDPSSGNKRVADVRKISVGYCK